MTKPFQTYSQLLDKLVNEKKLAISNPEFAESVLKRISYFALIVGYKEPFKNPTTGTYRYNVEFNHILELYYFDESLRELFLKYIMQIERTLRSLISYHFSLNHGESQEAYLGNSNYNYVGRYQSGIDKLIGILATTATSKDHIYINHHRINHNNVPLWVLVNAITLGTLSKMYEYLLPKTKMDVAKDFWGTRSEQLDRMLSVVTKFRNVCAHGERLYCYKTIDEIPDLPVHSLLSIEAKNKHYLNGKNDLFAVVIILQNLLPSSDFRAFFVKLETKIDEYCSAEYGMIETELLYRMNFPYNWRNIKGH